MVQTLPPPTQQSSTQSGLTGLSTEALAQLITSKPEGYWEKAAARDSFLEFNKLTYAGYQEARHILYLIEVLEAVERGDIDRVIVTMPPRHSKSLTASEAFPAWYLGRNPDKRVIGCAHTDFLANTFSRRARNRFAHKNWPFEGIKISRDLSNIKSWDIANHHGGYVSAGVGGAVVGHGANVFLVDDPIKTFQEAMSASIRQGVWDWFSEVAATRLEPGGAVVIISTRWHEDDLTGRVLNGSEAKYYEVIHFDALCEEPSIDPLGRELDEPLWPERFSKFELDRKKREVGERAWAAQYQGRPTTAEGSLWKKRFLRFWHPPGMNMGPVVLREGDDILLRPSFDLPPFMDEEIQSWDMAFKKTTDGSYVVGGVWGRAGADCYLLDQIREHLSFTGSIAAVKELTGKWPHALAKLVESKANGPAVVDTLRSRVGGLIEVEPEGGKEARANAVLPLFESENVYLPHPDLFPWVHAWIVEAAQFPAGKFSDQVDSASQGLLRLSKSIDMGGVGGGTYSYAYDQRPREEDEEPDQVAKILAWPQQRMA
jgi:predicted phage terminase large subunit-like protein